METNESGTFQNLRACEKLLFELFDKPKGRLCNTGGDSFLAEFTSAVSAIECAAEFQNAVNERNRSDQASVKLEFRIGINSGDVIKDNDNLLKDSVNIASRLEALAQANGITISKVIYDYVNGKTKFDFNDLGVQKIKQNEFHAYDLFLSTRQERKVSGQVQNRYSIIIATIATILAALTGTYFFIH